MSQKVSGNVDDAVVGEVNDDLKRIKKEMDDIHVAQKEIKKLADEADEKFVKVKKHVDEVEDNTKGANKQLEDAVKARRACCGMCGVPICFKPCACCGKDHDECWCTIQ